MLHPADFAESPDYLADVCTGSTLRQANLTGRCEWWQEAEDSPDEYMLSSAKNLVSLSSQRLNLTTLGGRRDMSMLLAQSAVQV